MTGGVRRDVLDRGHVVAELQRASSEARRLAELPLADLAHTSGGADGIRELVATCHDLRRSLEAVATRCLAALDVDILQRRFSPAGVEATAAGIRHAWSRGARRVDRMLLEEYLVGLQTAGLGAARDLVDLVRSPRATDEAGPPSSVTDADGGPDPATTELVDLLDRLTQALTVGDGEEVAATARRVGAADAARQRRSSTPGDPTTDLAVVEAIGLVHTGRDAEAVAVLAGRLDRAAGPRLHTELAAVLLMQGNSAGARAQAAAAADTDSHLGDGPLALALVSEWEGDLASAAARYREALAHWSARRLAFPERITLRSPTGLWLRELAAARLRAGLVEQALEACDDALARGVIGPETYPDLVAHRIRADALALTAGPERERRAALYEVAKRQVWIGPGDAAAVADAVALLEAMTTDDDPPPHAGWYLAEALRLKGWLEDTPPLLPDARAAEDAWSTWARHSPAPARPEDSWIYWSGANIAEDLALTGESPAGDGVSPTEMTALQWQALLRIEKALYLEPGEPSSWATAARVLKTVGLTVAAREARARANELDPTNVEAYHVQLIELTNLHQPEAVLEHLGTVGAPLSSDQHAFRAWARLRTGDLGGALDDLDAVEPTPEKQAFLLSLRHSLLVRRADLAGARPVLRSIATLPRTPDPSRAAQRANALLLLGREDEAADALRDVDEEEPDRLAHLVLAHALHGRAVDAAAQAGRMAAQASVRGDLQHQADDWQDAAMLLDADAATRPAAQILRDAVAIVLAARVPPADADAEHEALRASGSEDPVAPVALEAVRARRLREAGRHQDAADAYRQLQGTVFDPEAGRALHDVVRASLDDAVRAGRAHEARLLHELLARDDRSPYPTACLAVAEAYDHAGEPDKALDALRDAADHPDPGTRAQVTLTLGMREARHCPERALEWMRAAQSAATTVKDPRLVARIDARLGVLVLLAEGRAAPVEAYFARALHALSAEDDPAFALEFEIRRAVSNVPSIDQQGLRAAYLAACRAEDRDPAPWGLTDDAPGELPDHEPPTPDAPTAGHPRG